MVKTRSNSTHSRNLILSSVVNRHKNDPEFLASLISTGIRGNVRREAQRHINRLKNQAARNLTGRVHYMSNVAGLSRRNRSLLNHAVLLAETPENTTRMRNARNFSRQGIKPIVEGLRRVPGTNRYTYPHITGSLYNVNNRGNVWFLVPGFENLRFKIASNARRNRGRLKY